MPIIITGNDQTTFCDTDKAFVPQNGARFRIINTRWSGAWLILTLKIDPKFVEANREAMWECAWEDNLEFSQIQRSGDLLVMLSTDDTERLLTFFSTATGRRGKDSMLGHWLVGRDDAWTGEVAEIPSLEFD